MPSAIDILLVDDEPRNLDVLVAVLESPGYRLLRAADADRALLLLMDHDVAAIVLDIKMPEMNGLDLARLIKGTRRFRETPILFLTAQMVDDERIIAGYDAGAVDVLTKPFNPQVLRHKIAVFAQLHSKTRELAELNATLEDRVRERTGELERSEAALRAAAEQKDEFLAVLAHELRNPLVPLRTGLDVLLRREHREAPVARTLGAMDRQLHHMVRLIDDLLDVSRITRGSLELKREPAEIGAVVAATVDAVRPMFERRRQLLVLEGEGRYQASIDTTRVAQIVTNLLTNASKFTSERGRTTVRVASQGEGASIQVTDTGAGIPVGELDRVFGMFARISRPGVASPAGLGIGLALARRLAEMHGGTLTAASGGENMGSTFTLWLPLGPALEASPVVAPPTVAEVGPAPSQLRIVIIEDNEDVAHSLKDLLEDTGHHVWLAQTGSDGVSLVEEVRPNVVLCDLGLPYMGGLEVCQRIRALPSVIRPIIIAVTGWGREEDQRRTREAGFDHHLIKPVAVESLDQVLRTVAS
jgi:signal transduction histidine kinase